jgi:hypothetical protein
MAAALLLSVFLVTAQQPPAVPVPPPPAPAAAPAVEPPVTADELPVSIDRIQRALAGPPPIELKEQHPVFRLEVYGRKASIEDLLGEKFWIGPTPYGGMTHQEFLDMVTPQLAQSYAGFTGKYLIAETALTLFEQWALKSAIKHFRGAANEREREAARKEVLDALSRLERARREAGIDK